MTSDIKRLLDPSACTCFPVASSSQNRIFTTKIKWSTLSIGIALLLIIVYASSGLYTLIDITTSNLTRSNHPNVTIFWSVSPSPTTISSRWIPLSVYVCTVLLTIIFLREIIQSNKPWILFLWSIVMIIISLADGILTLFYLLKIQEQISASSTKIKILFFLMIIRLLILLCGIFISIFYSRQLSQAQADYLKRQEMIVEKKVEPAASPSINDSWIHSVDLLNPSKDDSAHHFIADLPSLKSLPRDKVATVQRHLTSTVFQSRIRPLSGDFDDDPLQSPIDEECRYNIPLEERFYHEKTTEPDELE